MKKEEIKIFYRVSNTLTQQGLWYSFNGEFTGLIHDKFNFCMNKDLQMDYDDDLKGYLSATDSLETLFQWFPKEDILQLQNFGYYIHIYQTNNYKFYEKFQHLIINQCDSELIGQLILN